MARPQQVTPSAHYEWGVRLDCHKNGCDPPHSDDGRVTVWSHAEGIPDPDTKINGHATQRVFRRIPAWEDI